MRHVKELRRSGNGSATVVVTDRVSGTESKARLYVSDESQQTLDNMAEVAKKIMNQVLVELQ